MSEDGGIDIFLSHSSRDAELAEALVELFRAAYTLPAKKIRCTSVDGYRLKTGADTNDQLRKETVGSRVLVGLITDVSIESAYVLFELGARWGANKYLAPLLGAGRGAEILAGPLGGLNAMKCTRAQLLQLVGDVAAELGMAVEPPNVYAAHVDRVVAVSTKLEAERASEPAEHPPTKQRTANLSDFECDYLMTMARPRNEGFFHGGIDDHTGREAAKVQDAVKHFKDLDLVDYHNGGHRYTENGWKLCDQLWVLKILDALEKNKLNDAEEIAAAVELTDGEGELEELNRLLDTMEEKGLVKLTKTSGDTLAEITPAGLTHRKHRPLTL